jgi:hypothetical protein
MSIRFSTSPSLSRSAAPSPPASALYNPPDEHAILTAPLRDTLPPVFTRLLIFQGIFLQSSCNLALCILWSTSAGSSSIPLSVQNSAHDVNLSVPKIGFYNPASLQWLSDHLDRTAASDLIRKAGRLRSEI